MSNKLRNIAIEGVDYKDTLLMRVKVRHVFMNENFSGKGKSKIEPFCTSASAHGTILTAGCPLDSGIYIGYNRKQHRLT